MTLSTPSSASALLLGVVLSASAGANASNLVNQRGYESCVRAFDTSDLTGVHYPRVYYIRHEENANTYFVNASAWENGIRVNKRVSCETSKNGRVVHSVESADGRYALARHNRAIVAKR